MLAFDFRPVQKPSNFKTAIVSCTRSSKYNIKQNLMTIEKLRYFHREGVRRIYGRGLWRVNAIKNGNKWMEFVNNKLSEISFQNFDFDPKKGKHYDTLAFHPSKPQRNEFILAQAILTDDIVFKLLLGLQ